MRLTFHEKIVLVFLSVSLITGAAALHARHSRPFREITVIENGIKEELTLKQVKERLDEARKVDINVSTSEEITAIPGIGEVLAGRIVEYRNAHGGFSAIEDLLNVKGVGEKKLEKIREHIKIG